MCVSSLTITKVYIACVLQVADNSISTVSDSITNLQQLSILAMGENSLSALPDFLSSTPSALPN
jgi:Leucine-rich repeat (LRR) protein